MDAWIGKEENDGCVGDERERRTEAPAGGGSE